MDLYGPIPVHSLIGSSYIFVVVDDYSHFTWVSFPKDKSEAFQEFSKLSKQLQIYENLPIVSIRSDHGRVFDQKEFIKFFNDLCISHNFSVPRTPQQNGVVERENRTLEDMARTMLCESRLHTFFWAEAVNTPNYVLNHCLVRIF